MKTKLTIIATILLTAVVLLARQPQPVPAGTQRIQMRDKQTHLVLNEGLFRTRGTIVQTKEGAVWIYNGGLAGVLTVWNGFDFASVYVTINGE